MPRSLIRQKVVWVLVGLLCTATAMAQAQDLMTLTFNVWARYATIPVPADGTVPSLIRQHNYPVFADQFDVPLQDLIRASRKRVAKSNCPELPDFTIEVHGEGLSDPDGIAVDPRTSLVYVSEESANRVSVIDRGRARTVISSTTPIFEEEGGVVSDTPLQSPEGLAFTADGNLYAVEDLPGGRLIRFPIREDGTCSAGYETPVPGGWDAFAWEDVDTGPNDELLLVGSDLEGSLSPSDGLNPFSGAILYRDQDEEWWLVHKQYFAGFSASRLSEDGRWVVYTCELTGEIGWIDISDRNGRGGCSTAVAKSPEGVCMAPNGMILVAEERGTILSIHPLTGKRTEVARNLGTIESLEWDARNNRVLVAADGVDKVLSLVPKETVTDDTCLLDSVKCGTLRTAVHVPEDCPMFLEKVFARAGVSFDAAKKSELSVSFRQLASRLPIVAMNALVEPIGPARNDPDPVVQVQFAVFQPNEVILTEEGVTLPSALFAVARRSGKIIRTKMEAMGSRVFADGASQKDLAGNMDVVVPYPASVTVTEAGVTTVQFLGMGRTDDYHVVIDPNDKENNYMMVDGGDGTYHQYRLRLTSDIEILQNNIVISYFRELDSQWVQLGRAAAL